MYIFKEPVIVITDFHLKLYDKRIDLIKQFLNDIVYNYEQILILGDFFEFFTTFPEVVPSGYLDILIELKKLSEKKKIFYVEGNHDFNLKDFYNIFVFSEKFSFKIDDKLFIAIHGDTVDTNDVKYKYLRKFLRSTIAKILMDNLPPYVVLKIAKKLSSSSEKYLRKKESSNLFKKFFEKSPIIKDKFDILISGHFHINDNFEIDGKKIYLLNGIENHGINYLHISEKGVEFRKWKF